MDVRVAQAGPHLLEVDSGDWDLGGLLTRGVPVGFDPECQACHDEARQDERDRARAERRAAAAESAAAHGASDAPPGPAWLLLVYALPAHASAERAAVWRALKRAGAIALRDGAAILPDAESSAAAFLAIASRVDASGGQATLVRGGRLSPEVAQRVEQQIRDERRAELGGAAEEARRLLEDVRRGHECGCLTFEHLERLEAKLGVLWRGVEQIRARDYFGAAETTEIDDSLRGCEDALSAFEAAAAGLDEAGP